MNSNEELIKNIIETETHMRKYEQEHPNQYISSPISVHDYFVIIKSLQVTANLAEAIGMTFIKPDCKETLLNIKNTLIKAGVLDDKTKLII